MSTVEVEGLFATLHKISVIETSSSQPSGLFLILCLEVLFILSISGFNESTLEKFLCNLVLSFAEGNSNSY